VDRRASNAATRATLRASNCQVAVSPCSIQVLYASGLVEMLPSSPSGAAALQDLDQAQRIRDAFVGAPVRMDVGLTGVPWNAP
jgi:hypothetical protein